MTRRTSIVAGSVLVFMILSAMPAHACSCAPLDPRSTLQSADAAFVGALVSEKRGLLGLGSATFTFRVEHVVKGSLGGEVDVQSSSDGASCGLEVVRGQRIGLLLDRDGEDWMSNLCWQADPDALLRAAGPLPAPDGSGPIRFAVGGKFGGIRVLALDEKGRTLGYGVGEGTVLRLSVCPGSMRLAELVQGDGPDAPLRIAVRDVRTLGVLGETPLDRSAMKGITKAPGIDVSAISCRDRLAREVLAIAIDWPEGSGRGHLLRIGAGTVQRVVSFSAQWGAFSADAVHLFRGPNPADSRMLISLDIRTGTEKQLAALPAHTWQAAFSPGGKWLAGVVSSDGPEPSLVFLLDLQDEPDSRPITHTLGGFNVTGQMKWLDERRVVFFPGGGDDDSLRVFDTSLHVLFSLEGWSDHRATVVGDRAYGIQDQSLVSARVPGGSIEVLRRFDSPNTFAFAYVPGDALVDATVPVPEEAAPRPRVHTGASGSPGGVGAWPFLFVPLGGLAILLGLRLRRTRH